MWKASVLSVALVVGFVNAAESSKSKNILTWDSIAQKLEKEVTEESKAAAMFEHPEGATVKRIGVDPEETVDGKNHVCSLYRDSSAPPKPLWFVLGAQNPGLFKNERDDTYFQVGLDGKLSKAIFGRLKLDETGKSIPGSGVTEPQDIESPRVRDLFQHEVDFWLRDMYRKKPAAKPTQK